MIYGSKPWLKSYDPGVEAEIEIPDISLKDYFVNSFTGHAARAGCHYLGATMTFGELLESSGRFARALSDNGMGKGDVVAINLPNTPQYLIAIVGALRAGCAISGLAPLLMPDEMAYQLNNCKARILVTLDMLFDAKFLPIVDQVPALETILVTGVFDPLPTVTEYPAGKPIDGKTVVPFMDFLQQYPDNVPEIACAGSDPCYLQYTGGTTGPPKGAVLTHGNMVANIYQFERWMHMERGMEIFLSGFPMFHQAGLFVTSCAMAWAGTHILIPDPRNTGHIIKEYEQYRPTFLINVPSLFLMLLAEEDFRKQDFSQVRYCMSGAAPFPVDGIKDLENVVGAGKMWKSGV